MSRIKHPNSDYPSEFVPGSRKTVAAQCFFEIKIVEIQENGHAFENSKNVTCTWPIPFVCQTRRGNREKGKSISGAEGIKKRPFQLEMSVWTI